MLLFLMRQVFSLICSLSILCFSVRTFSAELTLGYPEFKPYTYTENGITKGLGVEWLDKIAKELKLTIKFEPIDSYGNGVNWLKENKIDGLFLASQNNERDALAFFSHKLTDNKWVWITKKNNHFDFDNISLKKSLRISTHTNANTHVWLKKNNYSQIYPTTDVQAMIRQLMHDRIDAVFLAEQVFLDALTLSPWSHSHVKMAVEVSKPFGVYISKNYLSKNKEFMTKLNLAIEQLKQQ